MVFCFAVITEIRDNLGALEAFKNIVGQKAYVEIALAKPIVYFSRSLYWLKGFFNKEYFTGVSEIRHTKAGWMINPSLKIVRHILGDEFKVVYHGKGLKYDMISIEHI